MGLTSAWLVVALSLLAACPVAVILGRRPSWQVRGSSRWIATTWIVLAQLLVLFPAAALANDAFDFFPSWSSLAGTTSHRIVGQRHTGTGTLEAAALAALRRVPPGRGALIRDEIVNPSDGLATDALVYIPAAYAERRKLRFPVVELLHGYPGSIASFTRQLGVVAVLDEEIRTGRMAPTIAVIPAAEVTPPRDTECVNVTGGPAVENLLGPDLHSDLVSKLRVRPDRSAWGTMGYSTGGFCAVNLALHHPDLYSGAVSMSGYFAALRDITTGDLYGTQQVRDYDSPTWFVHHERLLYPLRLLLATAAGEHGSIAEIKNLTASAPQQLDLSYLRLEHGGHSFDSWRTMMPTCLDWLSSHLTGPIAASPGGRHVERSPSPRP